MTELAAVLEFPLEVELVTELLAELVNESGAEVDAEFIAEFVAVITAKCVTGLSLDFSGFDCSLSAVDITASEL